MKKILLLAAATLLSSCNGPWNMMAEDYGPGTPKLWVSSFAVADLPLDTLWIERPQILTQTYDSTLQFVDTAASRIRTIRMDIPDTIEYRLAPGSAVAWLPTRRVVVARGGTYRLDAKVRWTTAGGEGRTDSLSATTRVPRTYRIFDWALAPIEALVPWAGSVAKVADAPADQRAVLDRYLLTDATLDSVRANLPVYRQVERNDTVWYIHDATKVPDLSPVPVQRTYRNYLFAFEVNRPDWSGALAVQNWDTSGAYIQNLLDKQFQNSLGEKEVDSLDFYQKGNLRALGFEPAYNPGRTFPGPILSILDSLARFTGTDIQPWTFSNILLGYTGRNVIRVYALDEHHYEYYSKLAGADNANNLRYTNISGGDGHFTSAAVDSFPLFVRATQDTFSVSALRGTWCRDKKEAAKKRGEAWNPGALCAGY